MKNDFFKPPRPRLFAHRGCASMPENTMEAFHDAMAKGLRYLELDVRCASDGIPMVHHDCSLMRLCGVDRPLARLDKASIQALDAGYTFNTDCGRSFPFRGRKICIPTLEEVLTTFRSAMITVEIKDKSQRAVEAVLEVVSRTGRGERLLIASAHDAVVRQVRRRRPDLATSFGRGEIRFFYAWLATGASDPYIPPAEALQIPLRFGGIDLVTERSLAVIHALGLEAHIWTINKEKEIRRLLALGVDGIMSDYPERLAPYLP